MSCNVDQTQSKSANVQSLNVYISLGETFGTEYNVCLLSEDTARSMIKLAGRDYRRAESGALMARAAPFS